MTPAPLPRRRKRSGAAPGAAPARMVFDEVDWRLLSLLQEDARRTSAELGRAVELSPPGVQKRLRKLEEEGVIRGYATIVAREAIGLDLLCFVQVSLAHHEPRTVQGFRDAVKAMPEVLECQYLTGEFDYLLKVVVADHAHLERFLFEKLTQARGVDKIRTSIVLNEIKHSTSLPLGNGARRDGDGAGALRNRNRRGGKESRPWKRGS